MGEHKAQRSKFHKLLNEYYYARKNLVDVIHQYNNYKFEADIVFHKAPSKDTSTKLLRHSTINRCENYKNLRYKAEVRLSKAQEALHDFIS